MDDVAFDRLSQLLGTAPNRRTALGLATGAIAGGLARLFGAAEADAGKKKKKSKGRCPKKPCPRGQLRNKRTCECECARQSCSGGKEFDIETCSCRCPRDMRECRDSCIGPDRCCPGDPPCPEDPKGCCHAPGLDVCTIDGCCRELDGMKACNDFCVDTNTHPSHCGNCNVVCGSGETCVDGECGAPECANGQPPCGGQCCGENEICAGGNVCESPFACPRVACTRAGLVCCPPNSFTNSAYCCPAGAFCRNTVVGCSAL